MGAPPGERNGHCTIPDGVVLYVRNLYEHENLPAPEIARRAGIACLRTVKALIYYERRPFPNPNATPIPMPQQHNP